MARHIAPLNMGEDDAKADILRHNAEVKTVVPAEKVRGYPLTASSTYAQPYPAFSPLLLLVLILH